MLTPKRSEEIHGFGGKTFWWQFVMLYTTLRRIPFLLQLCSRVCYSLTQQVSFSSLVVIAYLLHQVKFSDLGHDMRHGSKKHQVSTHTRIIFSEFVSGSFFIILHHLVTHNTFTFVFSSFWLFHHLVQVLIEVIHGFLSDPFLRKRHILSRSVPSTFDPE